MSPEDEALFISDSSPTCLEEAVSAAFDQQHDGSADYASRACDTDSGPCKCGAWHDQPEVALPRTDIPLYGPNHEEIIANLRGELVAATQWLTERDALRAELAAAKEEARIAHQRHHDCQESAKRQVDPCANGCKLKRAVKEFLESPEE
jgi:hypothetical protein